MDYFLDADWRLIPLAIARYGRLNTARVVQSEAGHRLTPMAPAVVREEVTGAVSNGRAEH